MKERFSNYNEWILQINIWQMYGAIKNVLETERLNKWRNNFNKVS